MKITTDDFTRLDNCINGNPRYYIGAYLVDDIPHKQLNKLGFVKYRGKKYGAGYVTTSYNLQNEVDLLNKAINNA